MRLLPIFIGAISLVSSHIYSIDLQTHCACRQLCSVITQGKSIAQYKQAWYTLLHSKTISLQEKQALIPQALQLAKQTKVKLEELLAELNKDPHYGTKIKTLATLALSSYLVSSVVACLMFKINLTDPRANYFFPISRLLQMSHKLASLSPIVGTLQLATGATVAPCAIAWSAWQLYTGPLDIRQTRERINNLDRIMLYLQSTHL
jgi:hypothetical protein